MECFNYFTQSRALALSLSLSLFARMKLIFFSRRKLNSHHLLCVVIITVSEICRLKIDNYAWRVSHSWFTSVAAL